MAANNQPASKYVLIDLENVQPANLQMLDSSQYRVWVFVGISQRKGPIDLAEALQKLGTDSRYLRITGSGRNALDFHIAFYLGEIAAKEPRASFVIISRDKGFDPLVNHLRERKITIARHADLAEITGSTNLPPVDINDQIDTVVQNLIDRGASRPRRVSTLRNSINSLFAKELHKGQLDAIIRQLIDKGYVKAVEERVSYKLPRGKGG